MIVRFTLILLIANIEVAFRVNGAHVLEECLVEILSRLLWRKFRLDHIGAGPVVRLFNLHSGAPVELELHDEESEENRGVDADDYHIVISQVLSFQVQQIVQVLSHQENSSEELQRAEKHRWQLVQKFGLLVACSILQVFLVRLLAATVLEFLQLLSHVAAGEGVATDRDSEHNEDEGLEEQQDKEFNQVDIFIADQDLHVCQEGSLVLFWDIFDMVNVPIIGEVSHQDISGRRREEYRECDNCEDCLGVVSLEPVSLPSLSYLLLQTVCARFEQYLAHVDGTSGLNKLVVRVLKQDRVQE